MIKRKLFILWELPQLCLAMLIFLCARKNITGKMTFKDTHVFFLEDFPGGISLAFIIFLNKIYENDLKVIKHEYGHSRQSLKLGWLYLFIVGIPSLIRALIWNIRKSSPKEYFARFPENWADRLGG